MKNFFVSFILVFSAWLLLNSSLTVEYIVSGVAVATFLAVWSSMRFPAFKNVKMTPKAFFAFIIYIFVFLFELLKSNFDVAKRVLSPSLPVNPGIVEVKTSLKSPMGRLLLANSITLTPGTLTVEIKGDSLFIHWIDVSSTDVDKTTEKIVKGFEKYLEVIYD